MNPRHTATTQMNARPGVLPLSPAEHIEPTRPPKRPVGRRRKRESKRMRGFTRLLSGILTLLFFALLIVAGALGWFHHSIDAQGPLKELRTVTIPPGDSSRMIADRLEQHGVISGQTVFLAQVMSDQAVARLSGRPSRHLKAGEYEMQAGISVRQIIKKLTEGKSLLYSVTVPEGLTSHQIVSRLKRDQNLSGEISQIPGEGSLLPETFRVPRNTPRSQVLAMLGRELNSFLDEKWKARTPDLPLRSKQEALVLASIVEKETGPKDNPARIAGVFVNRIRRGIRLQSDPTILYGKHGPSVDWGAKIFRSDINRKTAYNTYQINGLPPTPICNPGRKSIEAVLNPSVTKELYFVANGRGGHIFSETLRDHENAVRDWRKIERGIRKKQAEKVKADKAEKAASAASANLAPTLINTKQVSTVTVQGGNQALIVPLPVKRPKQ